MHPKIKAILDDSDTRYTVHRHADLPGEIRSPKDFATQLGVDLVQITKSLFVRSAARDKFAVLVCSMGTKVDFKRIAEAMAVAKVELASPVELQEHLDYPVNGVSPLGAKGCLVFMDSPLFSLPRIWLGAGVSGIEVEMPPADLQRLTLARSLRFTL